MFNIRHKMFAAEKEVIKNQLLQKHFFKDYFQLENNFLNSFFLNLLLNSLRSITKKGKRKKFSHMKLVSKSLIGYTFHFIHTDHTDSIYKDVTMLLGGSLYVTSR